MPTAQCPFCHTEGTAAIDVPEGQSLYRVVCRTDRGGCGGATGLYRTVDEVRAAWSGHGAENPPNPVYIRERCPRCLGDGIIMVAAREDTILRAKAIDPGAWSLGGSAARRSAAAELAEKQVRAALE